MIRMDVKLDLSKIVDVLGNAIDDDVKLYAHMRYADIISPWVPMDQGVLWQGTVATPEELTYIAPYAHYQWAGKTKYGKSLNYRHDKHPMAADHWEEAAMRTKMDDFVNEIKRYIKLRQQNG